MRIERGSDIAAACGQLALTAVKGAKGGSGLVGGNAATMRDIEEVAVSLVYVPACGSDELVILEQGSF